MLKLHRLELSGFKSFVDPVTIDFAGGITAIVGPNGCGKSNLSDGISWVLGEQSAKSLRGGTMEDVIFNGSENRRPLGMAEATLTLATDPAFPRAVEGRIVIGRRVFRTGESQYRLNGKLVRLKEIKDLLMDTGLGIRTYSVIEQGKIGMILSGKPQERRRLLEEAAGITRYKARKRVAEVKLQEAMANLLRLDDIISEVERALRSLKRQAGAARRYQEKQAELKDLLRKVLGGRWSLLATQMTQLEGQLAAVVADEAELTASLSRDEAALAAGREAQDRQARALADAHQRRSDLAATIQGRQEFLKSSRQTLQEIAERAAGGRSLAERREQEGQDHRRLQAELTGRREELLEERDRAAVAVEEDQHAIRAADADLRQAEARVGSMRKEVLTAATEVGGLQNRLHQGQIEQEKANYRRHHLEEELQQSAFELEQAGEALATSRDRVAQLEGDLATTGAALEKDAAALEDTLRRESQATRQRQDIAEELTAARQRRDVLVQLNQAHEEKRSSLEEALAGAGFDEPHYLAGRLAAVEGWERGLDFYLGALTDAVVLDESEAGLTLARYLAEHVSGAGGATLLRPVEAPAPSDFDDPAVVLSAAQALGLPPELARALPPAYLVESAEDAERLARSHPGIDFISRDGIWAAGGLLHVEGGDTLPGVLARDRELAELAEAIPALETRLAEAARTIEELVTRRAEFARQKNQREQALGQLRQDFAVAQARQQDLGGRYERLAAAGEKIREQKEEIDGLLARLAERRRGHEAELEQATSRHRSLEESLERAQAEVEAAKEHRESLRTASAGRRGRLEVLQERLDSVEGELRRIESEIEEGERQRRLWQEEASRLDSRSRELEEARAKAEDELREALAQQEDADAQVILEQEKLDDLRSDILSLEERITATRTGRDEVRSSLEQLRIQQASLNQNREHLAATFHAEFDSHLPDPPDAPRRDLPELEADMARCKATLERLGPVNVLAVEEYDEQEQRFAFLTTQRADVADSVASLKRTIREINEESSERFRATFAEVNKTFSEVFVHLFRGGEAEMRLMDDEDVLESGIEIVARPPGKRLQNIMLMSGGEKALTAIALLFALFRTKPSPFCILDEVDAPLDDANTLRFVETLQSMATGTQFLVVTHNKLTMEAAATLYGVTMEERGVSKLVSVEMEDVHPSGLEMRSATA